MKVNIYQGSIKGPSKEVIIDFIFHLEYAPRLRDPRSCALELRGRPFKSNLYSSHVPVKEATTLIPRRLEEVSVEELMTVLCPQSP